MSRRRDVRAAVIENALLSASLSAPQKVFLLTVAMLPAERVDGKQRTGSKSMGPDGKFALHLDYLARVLNTSATNAKKLAERCAARGYLSKVHPGTYGRPATWQALDVRGDRTYRITLRSPVAPYVDDTPHIREDSLSSLTYRTPGRRNPAPASGGSPQVPLEVVASTTGDACRWHGFAPCPEDCADHRASREESA